MYMQEKRQILSKNRYVQKFVANDATMRAKNNKIAPRLC